MKHYVSLAIFGLLAAVCMTNGIVRKGSGAMSVGALSQSSNASSYDQNETTASKIARALSVGPPDVTNEATLPLCTVTVSTVLTYSSI